MNYVAGLSAAQTLLHPTPLPPPLRLFRGRPTAEVTLPAPLPIWCIVRVHFALTVLLPERAADK